MSVSVQCLYHKCAYLIFNMESFWSEFRIVLPLARIVMAWNCFGGIILARNRFGQKYFS